MLQADAHGETLGLEVDALFVQEAVDVAGRVAGGEDYGTAECL